MKILISAVGDTDPIRNFHDGALVHIARKYRPDKIIIVFSERTIGKKDDIEKVLHAIDPEYVPEIVIHKPIILNADIYVFDTMYDQFESIIQQYYTKDDELLLNLSSATPQVKAALFIINRLSEINVKAIQVPTPVNDSNENVPHDNVEDIDILIDTNEDNVEDFVDRTLEDESEKFLHALMKKTIRTPHEEAVFNNIQFMESVHAKSYSSIFSTLNTKSEIEEIFEWTNTNPFLQKKAEIINEIYLNGTPLEKKVASVFLETFLFYSGFFTPLYYLGNNKLANVAEIIKLIIRDESVHGTYIGYKFQLGFNELPEDEQEKLKEWMYDLLYTLYENEEGYTESLYDGVGWTEEVKTFLRYNANKALMNLGQDPLFPDSADDVNPIVMNGISTGTSNHDFFSQVGNGYLLGEVEAMQDDDYNYGL